MCLHSEFVWNSIFYATAMSLSSPKPVYIERGICQAEVISERTDAFHKFLNLVATCDKVRYSSHLFKIKYSLNVLRSFYKHNMIITET
jgi:hypothetical protein